MPSKLVEFEISRPGILGVNTAASGDVMPKEYSVQSTNLIISDEGYPITRHGSKHINASTLNTISTAGSAQSVRQIYKTKDENGAELVIFSTENKIFKLSGTTVSDVTGTITAPTAGNWKFVNLNDKIIGFQSGHAAIELTTPSSGTFNDITFVATGSETPASSGAIATDILSAAGRLWVLDGDQLRYSSLLDHTDFSTSTDSPPGDGGAFDLNASMITGDDVRTALAEFNGNLLVMYRNNITVWGDIWNPNGTGADFGGVYPGVAADNAMSVIENISGVGCIARDSIQKTQNDMLFLSAQGITSLSRVVQEKSMPINRLTDNVRKEVNELVRSVNLDTVWSVYFEGKGIYLFGSGSYSNTFYVDVTGKLPDGTNRVLLWDKSYTTVGLQPLSTLTASDTDWKVLLVSETADYISEVTGYLDGVASDGTGGNTYDITYESAWTAIIDEFENHIKFPKKVNIVLKGGRGQDVIFNMTYDYGEFIGSTERTVTTSQGSPSRYGVNTYGGSVTSSTTAYYSQVLAFDTTKTMGRGSGRILKLKISATVNGDPITLQRISIHAKIGRQQ